VAILVEPARASRRRWQTIGPVQARLAIEEWKSSLHLEPATPPIIPTTAAAAATSSRHHRPATPDHYHWKDKILLPPGKSSNNGLTSV
jgi:hypothetical protein